MYVENLTRISNLFKKIYFRIKIMGPFNMGKEMDWRELGTVKNLPGNAL
jgi:hypothetical protein